MATRNLQVPLDQKQDASVRIISNYVKNTNNGLTSELCQKYSQHRQKKTKFADAECLSTAQYDHATKKTTPTPRSRQSAK